MDEKIVFFGEAGILGDIGQRCDIVVVIFTVVVVAGRLSEGTVDVVSRGRGYGHRFG